MWEDPIPKAPRRRWRSHYWHLHLHLHQILRRWMASRLASRPEWQHRPRPRTVKIDGLGGLGGEGVQTETEARKVRSG